MKKGGCRRRGKGEKEGLALAAIPHGPTASLSLSPKRKPTTKRLNLHAPFPLLSAVAEERVWEREKASCGGRKERWKGHRDFQQILRGKEVREREEGEGGC